MITERCIRDPSIRRLLQEIEVPMTHAYRYREVQTCHIEQS